MSNQTETAVNSLFCRAIIATNKKMKTKYEAYCSATINCRRQGVSSDKDIFKRVVFGERLAKLIGNMGGVVDLVY